jgi:uncharacterized protein (TIGR00290 family)
MNNMAIMNWSGGKDSALALSAILDEGTPKINYLFTTLSNESRRISMHGVREELLDLQAGALGIPLEKVYLPEIATMDEYEHSINRAMRKFSDEGISLAIFGDIFLEDLRTYREEQLKKSSYQAIFPLWKKNTGSLVKEFLARGFKTIVTCVNEKYLNRNFAGRILDQEFLNDLPPGVDPCGENGEFHTFVFDGPIFSHPIPCQAGEIIHKKYENQTDPHLGSGFWFCDVMPCT